MKKDFLTFAKGGFVLLDGGFGTELQRAGLPAGTPPEELNLTAPEKVLALHRAYIESGADVTAQTDASIPRRARRRVSRRRASDSRVKRRAMTGSSPST